MTRVPTCDKKGCTADGVVQSVAFRLCAMHAASDLRRLRDGIWQHYMESLHPRRTGANRRLWELLDDHQRVPVPEVDVCPKCGTEGAQCCI